jgi:predicted RNA binding protein YcfA (HicA-like mRNA interferase family)
MKLPRDLSGSDLIKRLEQVGYLVTRQTGSHIRLTCDVPIQHHVTIPNHSPLRIGTLSAILSDLATHLKITREELIRRLFG